MSHVTTDDGYMSKNYFSV